MTRRSSPGTPVVVRERGRCRSGVVKVGSRVGGLGERAGDESGLATFEPSGTEIGAGGEPPGGT